MPLDHYDIPILSITGFERGKWAGRGTVKSCKACLQGAGKVRLEKQNLSGNGLRTDSARRFFFNSLQRLISKRSSLF